MLIITPVRRPLTLTSFVSRRPIRVRLGLPASGADFAKVLPLDDVLREAKTRSRFRKSSMSTNLLADREKTNPVEFSYDRCIPMYTGWVDGAEDCAGGRGGWRRLTLLTRRNACHVTLDEAEDDAKDNALLDCYCGRTNANVKTLISTYQKYHFVHIAFYMTLQFDHTMPSYLRNSDIAIKVACGLSISICRFGLGPCEKVNLAVGTVCYQIFWPLSTNFQYQYVRNLHLVNYQ